MMCRTGKDSDIDVGGEDRDGHPQERLVNVVRQSVWNSSNIVTVGIGLSVLGIIILELSSFRGVSF